MTTAAMNRYELNDEEANLINGAGLLNWLIPNFPLPQNNKEKKPHYTLPEMDVDNRPAVTPPPFHPACHQA